MASSSLKINLPTPLYLAQANLSDPSPFCRHLMLLTESSAALRLLFECGLLRKEKTVVLVGSQFPRDANSELRMVRQINEIKRAMQSGHTVVLVNHEGIFPSLYDVLNMRYTTKRNAETGKVTRMLRLAVGNRSQWCAVGAGFKIVVVVESKDAYERLDLPLLNRFEKQMLRAEDALESPDAKKLCDELREWTKQVESMCRVKDAFVGLYSQTLASVVHYKSLENRREKHRELKYPDDLESLKMDLVALMSPLARIRGSGLKLRMRSDSPLLVQLESTMPSSDSPSLTRSSNEEEEEEVIESGSAVNVDTIVDEMRPSSSSSEQEEQLLLPETEDQLNLTEAIRQSLRNKTHLLVLTFSTTHDFDLLLKNKADAEVKEWLGDSEPIALSGVTSEREFTHALTKSTSEIRVVQCDPNTTPQETIEHARYLSVQELSARGKSELVVFLVHLPPGGRKKRNYNVDFQSGWKVVFIDDLLRPDFMSLVRATPLGWADGQDASMENLGRVIRSKLSVSLAQARHPLVGGAALMGARERVQQTLRFLEEPVFSERILQGTVRDILATMQPDEHVEMVARGEARAGTVADSLVMALETLVVRAFAMTVRWFDHNFNLALLVSDEPGISDLWLLLFAPPSHEFIAATQAEMSSLSANSTIRNSGRPGLPVVSQFPWSWRVFETLDQALVESAKVAAISPDNFAEKEKFLLGVAETVFTGRFTHISRPFVKNYLHDICGFQANRRPEISLEEQTRLVVSWLERKDSNALDSVCRAHLLFHSHCWALFSLLSLRIALVQLDFPDNALDFSRVGYVQTICDFMMDTNTMKHPLWSSAVGLLVPHMHAAFLNEEGAESKAKWSLLLFRHAYSEAMLVEPFRTPSNLLVPVDIQNKVVVEDQSAMSEFQQSYNRYLAITARSVVAQPWFEDTNYMKGFLSVIRSESTARTTRLTCMEAILRHPPHKRTPEIDEAISTDHALFAIALDLAEDIENGSEELLHLPPQVQQAVIMRENLREFAATKDLKSLGDDVVNKSVYARAFLLNELFALYGTTGVQEALSNSSTFLQFFHAPAHYIAKANGTVSDRAGTNKVAKMSWDDLRRKNTFSLVIGDQAFTEATALVDARLAFDNNNSNNNPPLYEEEEDSKDLAAAMRESKRTSMNQVAKQFLNKIASSGNASIPQMEMWRNLYPSVVSSTHNHVVLIALLMAAAGRTFATKQSLTSSGVPSYLNDFARNVDLSPSFRNTAQERVMYCHLIDLCCARVDETCWRPIFPDGSGTEEDRFVVLLCVLTTLLAEEQSDSCYLVDLLRGKGTQLVQCYMPGMTIGPLAEVVEALGEYVGWWTCPNGHRYAVGECTMPMERSICPDCRAPVGGKDHTPVAGVTRMDVDEDESNKPGYQPPVNLNQNLQMRSMRASHISIFHLFFHSCAMVAMAGPLAGGLRALFTPSQPGRRARQAVVAEQFTRETRLAWKVFRNTVMGPTLADKLGDAELLLGGICAHLCRGELNVRRTFQATSSSLRTGNRPRLESERGMQDLVRIAGEGLEHYVIKCIDIVKESLGFTSKRMELVEMVSNAVVLEAETLCRENDVSVEKNLDRIAFRYRTPLSFADMAHQLEPVAYMYPFLEKFCRVEPRLKLVTRLADILAWAEVLNEALAHRSHRLTREEAAKLSNRSALESLPAPRRERGFDILARFCKAFNETFHLVPFLYECQRNPYVTEDNPPLIDLSGAKGASGVRTEMSFDTPVCFSLSAIVQGDADAPSLCLFQLVRALQQLNNTILVELEQELANRRINAYGGGGAARQAPNNQADELDLPVTSMSTPSDIVLSRLVNYNRERDLIPILASCSGRAFNVGLGVPRNIDLKELQDHLKRKLLTGKRPLRVVIPSFEYAGEARRAGTLAGLRARIPQASINKAIAFNISAELDSDAKIQPLLELVDSAVGFLSGTGGFDGDTLLGVFAKNVLGVDEEAWMEIAPPTVQQHVRLCHLGALFTLLEEAKHGSPVDAVKPRYKRPLPSDMETEMRVVAGRLDLDTLLPILKELLVARLVEDSFPEDAPLAEYLEYSTDLDLSSLEWFRNFFPKEITLAYTFGVWQVWMNSV